MYIIIYVYNHNYIVKYISMYCIYIGIYIYIYIDIDIDRYTYILYTYVCDRLFSKADFC